MPKFILEIDLDHPMMKADNKFGYSFNELAHLVRHAGELVTDGHERHTLDVEGEVVGRFRVTKPLAVGDFFRSKMDLPDDASHSVDEVSLIPKGTVFRVSALEGGPGIMLTDVAFGTRTVHAYMEDFAHEFEEVF